MPLGHPLYLPEQRVACTPVTGGIRLAGTMEIAEADPPPDRRRIDAVPLHSTSILLCDGVLDKSRVRLLGRADRSLPMGFRSSGSRPTSECSPPAVTVCGG